MRIEELDPKTIGQFEVLVNMGLITLGAGAEWRRLKKYSPQARFPVVVAGAAFRASEVLDVRRLGDGSDSNPRPEGTRVPSATA